MTSDNQFLRKQQTYNSIKRLKISSACVVRAIAAVNFRTLIRRAVATIISFHLHSFLQLVSLHKFSIQKLFIAFTMLHFHRQSLNFHVIEVIVSSTSFTFQNFLYTEAPQNPPPCFSCNQIIPKSSFTTFSLNFDASSAYLLSHWEMVQSRSQQERLKKPSFLLHFIS